MGMKNGAATVGNSVAPPQNVKHKRTSDHGIVLLGIQLALRISDTSILGYGGLTVGDFNIFRFSYRRGWRDDGGPGTSQLIG